jgi:hypothetical protein
MAFQPIITNYVGMLPILQAAEQIIADDFAAALAWRCALDGSTPGANYARVQTEQMHSSKYPLLVVQPAQDLPDWLGTGGIQQRQLFDVEIFLTTSVDTGDPLAQVRALTANLVRYYEATRWAFECATADQWTAFAPAGADIESVSVKCGQGGFVGIAPGTTKETAGMYARSMAFEMEVRFTEAYD